MHVHVHNYVQAECIFIISTHVYMYTYMCISMHIYIYIAGLVTGENTDDECRPSAEDLGLRHKLYIMRPELLENYIR